MDAKTNNLLEGSIIRSLFTLAVPIVFANILQAAYQLIDAFWVGRLGADAVAAVSISMPFTFLTISLGAGLAIAGSTLIAQYVGARNQQMVDHIAGQTMLMVAIVSVVLGVAGYLAPVLSFALAARGRRPLCNKRAKASVQRPSESEEVLKRSSAYVCPVPAT